MTERPSAFALDRRGFIRLAGTTAAGWIALGATSDRMRIVASLTGLPLDDELTRRSMTDSPTSRLGGLIVGLRQRGWVEGVNFRLELRSTFGGPDKLKTAVQELLELKPDVILTGSTIETAAVFAATKTIPIVFATANDPVGNGFVESLAHPGGNVTGIFLDLPGFNAKTLQLLREVVPGIAKVAALWHPASGSLQLETMRSAASAVNVMLEVFEVRVPSDFDRVFQAMVRSQAAGVLMLSSPLFAGYPRLLADLALSNRLPAINIFPDFARNGGLIGYGPDIQGLFTQAGLLTRKVLQGTSVADLPIERPTRFMLVADLKTARALGITLPTSILLSADEVIE